MKWIDKIKDRYNILLIINAIIFIVMILRMMNLTITRGEELKAIADGKRVKEVSIPAARGEIKDRYGRVLATNKPTFTVQILKDELSKDNREESLLKLMKILYEEDEAFIDEFPIELNIISFRNEEDYEGHNIEGEIIKDLLNEVPLGHLLDTTMAYSKNTRDQPFIVAKKISSFLSKVYKENIFNITYDKEGQVTMTYVDTPDIDDWKNLNGISDSLDAKSAMIQLVKKNEKSLSRLLNDPLGRKIMYDLLVASGFGDKYKFNAYSYRNDDRYLSKKKELMQRFNGVSLSSSPRDDFANIVIQTSLEPILTSVFKAGEKSNLVVGQLIIERLMEKGVKVPVSFTVQEEQVTYHFKTNDLQKTFVREENVATQMSALEALIFIGQKHNVLIDAITNDTVKGIAQRMILNKGINPEISIAKWNYTSLLEKENWLDGLGIETEVTAEAAFDLLRKKYNLPIHLSPLESRFILLLLQQISSQGYRAYEPINIAYELKEKTVARIMESNRDMVGISIEIEPIRYYPMGETAAHVLGYLGKISQEIEIQKYIKESNYSPNDIIGKTGIEESFEKSLKGKDGAKKVEVDVFGNTTKVLKERKAIPGDTIYLTIDGKLQRVAEDALKQAIEEIQVAGKFKSRWGDYDYQPEKGGRLLENATSGATVAIDVKTGEILAMASYPSYDPNLFSTGISRVDWESLKPDNPEDPLAPRPLYNVALQTAVQPGSTFKMITALAGLEKGISPNFKINSRGYIKIGNQTFGDWLWNDYGRAYGPTDVFSAIKDSINYYFYTLMIGENLRTNEQVTDKHGRSQKVELEDIINLSKQFGLNDKTGIEINIPQERSGGVPKPHIKEKSVKRMMRGYLETHIRKYLKDDVVMTEQEIKDVIGKITDWVNAEKVLTRGEVMNRLSDLGLESSKVLEGERENLTDKIKYNYLNQAQWKITDSLNISIGQGQNSYTPLQITNYMATLVNGGYKNKVSIIDYIERLNNEMHSKKNVEKGTRIELFDYKHLDYVKEGMGMVAKDGTAKSLFRDFPVKVGAKTGTAEKDGINPSTGKPYDNYSWFGAFAPYDEPQIAVATLIFQGGHGGFSGPVSREIIAQYLGLNHEKELVNLSNQLYP